MKKIVLSVVLVSISFAIVAQKKTYNIGILLDTRTAEINPLILQLKNQIKAVIGEDATIIFPESNILVNNFDLQKAAQNYNKLLTNDTDIIIAIGLVNSVIINKQTQHKKPTILFGEVNKEFTAFDISKATSGINNFTYLVDSYSFLEDLTVFKELTGFKSAGVVIEAHMMDILPIKDTFDRLFGQLGTDYKFIPYRTVSDITSNLEGVDALYIANGYLMTDDEIEKLTNTLIEKKLPSFTTSGIEDVRLGIMATNQSENDMGQFFRRIALIVDSYVSGKALSEMPVYIDYNARLTINYNTATEVGVPIKYSLINTTDFVVEMKDTRAEKQYNLLSAIQEALGRNLALQDSEKKVEISGQNVKTAKSNYMPSLTATAMGTYVNAEKARTSMGNSPEFSTTGKIVLKQTIFSNANSADIAVKKNLKKAEQANYDTKELNTVANVSTAYFNALILKSNAQIRMRNLDLTKRNLQMAQENFEAGQKGKSDILRFQSQRAQNTQALIVAINKLEQGFIKLNQLLNNPIEMRIDVEDAELDKGLFKDYNYTVFAKLLDDPKLREPFTAFLVQEAKRNAPELKSLDYNLIATQRKIERNSWQRVLPTVSLEGQYNIVFGRSGAGSKLSQELERIGNRLLDEDYNVGINVSIPIFNRTQTNINKQTALIQKDQLQINKRNSELNIATNVRNGVLNLVNQMSNIELSKVSEQTAKENLALIQESYQQGAVNFVQLIDAQNNYLKAQLARANATYNFFINALQLERSIGHFFLLHSQDENNQFDIRFQDFLNKQ